MGCVIGSKGIDVLAYKDRFADRVQPQACEGADLLFHFSPDVSIGEMILISKMTRAGFFKSE